MNPERDTARSQVSSLYLKIGAGLTAVAAVAGASCALQIGVVDYQRGAATEINVAGRQRMLSQRTALFALEAAHASSIADLERTRDKHRQLVDLIAISHAKLLDGDNSMGLPGSPKPPVAELYFGPRRLDARVREYVELHRQLGELLDLRVQGGDLDDPSVEVQLNEIRATAGPLLAALHECVGRYEQVANDRIDGFKGLLAGLLLAMLGLLAAEALWLFRPMVRAIGRHLQAIGEQQRSLEARDAAMQLVLDSTGDGLLTCNLDGRMGDIRSASVNHWLGTGADVPVWELIYPEDEVKQLELQLTFDEIREDVMPFEVVVSQMPNRVALEDRALSLDLRRIRGEESESVLLVLSDITERLRAEEARRSQVEFQQIVSQILADGPGFQSFLREAKSLLEGMASMTNAPQSYARALHTLKGNASIFGFQTFAEQCHAMETRLSEEPDLGIEASLAELRAAWAAALDRFGSLVRRDDRSVQIDRSDYHRLLEVLRDPDLPESLLSMVSSWTEERIAARLHRIRRQVERLSTRLDKEVTVDVVDNGVTIPEDFLSEFWPSLVHVVRNSLDHGIEPPTEREGAGKSREGQLRIEAKRDGDSQPQLRIAIEDDGAGINWEALRAKARERAEGAETLSDEDLLFMDGLTSKTELTELSGRGVGMAEVRHQCLAHRGQVTVRSSKGRGTRIEFQFPLDDDGRRETRASRPAA
ncbi:MAG: ATP-binding protein [Myxococcota bacterium]